MIAVLPISVFGQGTGGASLDQFLGGLTPYYENHYIGLKYDIAPYSGMWMDGDFHEHDREEIYQTMEIFGRYTFSRRWYLHGHLPMFWAKMNVDGETAQNELGMGDMFASVHYKLWIHEDESHHGPSQEFNVGIGLKFPTGTIHLPDENLHDVPHFLFTHSSGSWDFFLISEFLYRGDHAGFALESFVEFATPNFLGFRYGHRFEIGGSAFYRAQLGKTFWIPSLGYRFEYIGDAFEKGNLIQDSRATFNIFRAGLDAYFGPVTIGGEALFPVGEREILDLKANIHGAVYMRFLIGQFKHHEAQLSSH